MLSVNVITTDEDLIIPSFRENRISLRLPHPEGIIDDEEFIVLYDMNTSKNPDLPYC